MTCALVRIGVFHDCMRPPLPWPAPARRPQGARARSPRRPATHGPFPPYAPPAGSGVGWKGRRAPMTRQQPAERLPVPALRHPHAPPLGLLRDWPVPAVAFARVWEGGLRGAGLRRLFRTYTSYWRGHDWQRTRLGSWGLRCEWCLHGEVVESREEQGRQHHPQNGSFWGVATCLPERPDRPQNTCRACTNVWYVHLGRVSGL